LWVSVLIKNGYSKKQKKLRKSRHRRLSITTQSVIGAYWNLTLLNALHYSKLLQVKSPSITTITILWIIHRPVYYLKHDISETLFSLRLQVEPIQLGPINIAGLSPSDRKNPVSETMRFK
jgi:hypothetical protein